jgi:hypothetical protein
MTRAKVDWSDVDEAARQMAGNWLRFATFVWSRGYRLEDADKWMIWYTSHRDSGLCGHAPAKASSRPCTTWDSCPT